MEGDALHLARVNILGTNRWFRFGDFTLDTSQGLLYQGEQRLRIAPKLIALLTLLVERRGNVVTRDEIIRTLWPNTVVEEGGLPRNISMLRRHLDSHDGVQHIENIPKRGYRFVTEVIELESSPFCPASVEDTPRETIPPAPLKADDEVLAVRPPSKVSRRWNLTAIALGTAVVCVFIVFGVMASAPWRMVDWKPIPVTTNAAALPVLAAAVSLDGKFVAYVEASSADATTYIRPLDSPRAHALEPFRGVVPSAVQWYPDNTNVLLNGFDATRRRYVAWSSSMLGGPPTIVLENAYKPAISPDGRHIAFYRNRNEIWLSGADGTAERLFITAPDETRFRLQPNFSADGTHLLVGRVTRLSYSPVIEAYRISDGAVLPIYDPNGRAVLDVLWLRDGEVLVSVIRGYSSSDVLSIEVDLRKRIADAPQTLLTSDDMLTDLRATADGKRFSAIRDHTQPDIYVGSLDTTGTALLNVRRLTLDNSWDRPSSWLDERTIVFHSNRQGHPGIYKQRLDQLHAEPLIVNEFGNVWPIVTPDRQSLWYYSKDANHNSAEASLTLTKRPLAGGPAQHLDTRSDAWRSLRCAISGSCIRVEREGDESVFYSFDSHNGGGRELLRTPWLGPFAFAWDIAPDGKHIAFVDRKQNVIGIVDLNIKPPRRAYLRINSQQGIQGVSWSADGTGVYASCFDDDTSSTWHISLDGEMTLLRHQPLSGGIWAKPSPDGRYLMLAESTKQSNVWLYEQR